MKPLATLATINCRPWCVSDHEQSPEPEVEPCLSDTVFAGPAWAYLRHTPATGTQIVANTPDGMSPTEWAAFRAGVDHLAAQLEPTERSRR
jgi:hypothetical protein